MSSDSVGNGRVSDYHRFFSHAKWTMNDLWRITHRLRLSSRLLDTYLLASRGYGPNVTLSRFSFEQADRFSISHFLFSSTLLVMKPTSPDSLLTEDSPREAEWEYPQSKLRTEQVIAEEHGDIPAVVLRIAGVYDEDCRSIPIAQQIRRIYKGELQSHFFPGNLEHGQSFVHLDDVAACFMAVIGRRSKLGSHEIFLMGEPDVVSYLELKDIIGNQLYGTRWATMRIPKTVAKAGAWVEEKVGQETFIKPWMIDAQSGLPPFFGGQP